MACARRWAGLVALALLVSAGEAADAQDDANAPPPGAAAAPKTDAASAKPRPKATPKPTPKPVAPENAPPAAAAKTPAAPTPRFTPPDPPLPVAQARQAGATACLPLIDALSRRLLQGPYDVQSGWDRLDPAHHSFQSVAGLALGSPDHAADGLAALFAAPLANGACEGASVEVYPLATDCAAAASSLSGARDAGALQRSRVLFDANGRRVILVPGFRGTCVAVSVTSTYAQ
jgi:hypothetical protein